MKDLIFGKRNWDNAIEVAWRFTYFSSIRAVKAPKHLDSKKRGEQKSTKIVISGPRVPGEGEIKIFQHMRENDRLIEKTIR